MSSYSIDDLVSSFSNGGHIGDEANDLQVLQAQLAETLFNSTSSSNARPVPSRQPSQQPLNTPTLGRTPSSSISYQSVHDYLQHNAPYARFVDEEMADEAMVEDILMQPSPPPSATLAPSQTHRGSASANATVLASDSSSLFTTTDPFYLDLLAQSQSRTTSPPFQLGSSASVFAQAGLPCHSSPFLCGQSHTSFPLSNSQTAFSPRRDSFASQPQPLMASAFDI